MWYIIKDILVNVLFILFPTLFFLVFLREDGQFRGRNFTLKFFTILLLSTLLTMTLPAVYSEEFKYDLRIIPIILAFIYGGLYIGVTLTASMLMLTFYLYPNEFFITLGNYVIASIGLSSMLQFYHRQSNKRKLLILSGFYLIFATLRDVLLIINGHAEQIPFTSLLSIITLVTLIFVIALIETIRKQITIQRELEHIEKMNAISQLAASVAHEIRNPMTTVRGFLQILSRSDSIPEADKSFISISIEELDRAQIIINDYLALSKPQKSPFEVINLSKVIYDSVQVISTYAIINNIEIFRLIEDSLTIEGYKHEIQQVLINLMKNGIEAMDDQGKMNVTAKQKEGQIEIVIQDTGSGISKEHLKRLGTPYYSTKDKGTGLGLTVSFEIIRRMRGTIIVKSQVNKGTSFTILLPAIPSRYVSS